MGLSSFRSYRFGSAGFAGSRRPRSRRGWRLACAATVVALVVGLVQVGTAQAVHNSNLFELGPAQGADILCDGSAANGPDWGDLFNATGQAQPQNFGLGGLAAGFL